MKFEVTINIDGQIYRVAPRFHTTAIPTFRVRAGSGAGTYIVEASSDENTFISWVRWRCWHSSTAAQPAPGHPSTIWDAATGPSAGPTKDARDWNSGEQTLGAGMDRVTAAIWWLDDGNETIQGPIEFPYSVSSSSSSSSSGNSSSSSQSSSSSSDNSSSSSDSSSSSPESSSSSSDGSSSSSTNARSPGKKKQH